MTEFRQNQFEAGQFAGIETSRHAKDRSVLPITPAMARDKMAAESISWKLSVQIKSRKHSFPSQTSA
jgi:hypothetical protein